MPEKYGLTDSDQKQMNDIFFKFKAIQKVVLFGSRAMNTFKKGSDVDLVLSFEGKDIISLVKDALEEETTIPYFFDVLDEKSIQSEELKEHIRHHGIVLYKK